MENIVARQLSHPLPARALTGITRAGSTRRAYAIAVPRATQAFDLQDDTMTAKPRATSADKAG